MIKRGDRGRRALYRGMKQRAMKTFYPPFFIIPHRKSVCLSFQSFIPMNTFNVSRYNGIYWMKALTKKPWF